jgi:hypothetical protein
MRPPGQLPVISPTGDNLNTRAASCRSISTGSLLGRRLILNMLKRSSGFCIQERAAGTTRLKCLLALAARSGLPAR